MSDPQQFSPGGGTDRRRPIPDPTANVVALVQAEARAAAALRKADIKYNDSQHHHLKEMASLRAKNAETARVSDLDRLAKTREVDVTTGKAQAEQLATAVQQLAVASDKNAEAIRNQMNSDRAALAKQVTDTAATLSANNDSAMKDVNNRIAELQKSSYQGVGKSSVADPMMAEFIQEMRGLVRGAAVSTGKTAGGAAVWAALAAGVLVLGAIVAMGVVAVALVVFLARPTPIVSPAAALPTYGPAPAGTMLPAPATVPR